MRIPLMLMVMLAGMLRAQLPLSRQTWTSHARWHSLRAGMTETQVRAFLGPPLESESSTTGQIWYYQFAPVRENGRVVERPLHGMLRFGFTKEGFVLRDWTQPNWVRLHEALRAEAQEAERRSQALLEEQQAQNEARTAERERLREEFARESERRRELYRRNGLAPETSDANLPPVRTETPEPAADPLSLNNPWSLVFIFSALALMAGAGFAAGRRSA